MAKSFQLVDDLDGGTEQVATRYFGIDGKNYEIDLSQENWDLLVNELWPFIEKGRKLDPRKTKTAERVAEGRLRSREENRRIRAWAVENGVHGLKGLGRLPQSVVDSYYEHHQRPEGTDLQRSA